MSQNQIVNHLRAIESQPWIFVNQGVHISVFLPTVGGVSAIAHPKSLKPRVIDP